MHSIPTHNPICKGDTRVLHRTPGQEDRQSRRLQTNNHRCINNIPTTKLRQYFLLKAMPTNHNSRLNRPIRCINLSSVIPKPMVLDLQACLNHTV